MENKLLINVTVAGIFDQPTFKSEMVTQSLLWEELTEINQKENWQQIITNDGYEGWIHGFYTVRGTRGKNKNAAFSRKRSAAKPTNRKSSNGKQKRR